MGDYPKHRLSNPIYITFPSRENSSVTERYWLPGAGGGEGLCSYLPWGSDHMSTYIFQNSSNYTLRTGTFTAWKLYVSKVDKKWEEKDKSKTQGFTHSSGLAII